MGRNNGIRNAAGEFIVFADDDFLLPTECIETVVALLKEGKFAGIASIINMSLPIEETWQQYLTINNYPLNRRIDEGEIEVDIFGGLMAFRRDLFDQVGFFDEVFGVLNPSCSGEDTEFCRRVRSSGRRLAIDPRVIVEHEIDHDGGCAARKGDQTKILRQQMRANLYIEMKFSDEPPRIRMTGWLRLLRASIINRALIAQGPWEIYRRLKLLKTEHADVRGIFLSSNDFKRSRSA